MGAQPHKGALGAAESGPKALPVSGSGFEPQRKISEFPATRGSKFPADRGSKIPANRGSEVPADTARPASGPVPTDAGKLDTLGGAGGSKPDSAHSVTGVGGRVRDGGAGFRAARRGEAGGKLETLNPQP